MWRDDRRVGRDVAAILTTLFLSVGASLLPGATAAIESEAWSDPPFSARPVARWWWPGGAVDAAGIKSELRRMRDAGYGAVELQPLLHRALLHACQNAARVTKTDAFENMRDAAATPSRGAHPPRRPAGHLAAACRPPAAPARAAAAAARPQWHRWASRGCMSPIAPR